MSQSEPLALNGHSGAKGARAANELVMLTNLRVLGDGDSHTSGGRSLSGQPMIPGLSRSPVAPLHP